MLLSLREESPHCAAEAGKGRRTLEIFFKYISAAARPSARVQAVHRVAAQPLCLHSGQASVSGPLFDQREGGGAQPSRCPGPPSGPGLRVEDSREGFPLVDWLTLACLLSLSPADSPPSASLCLCLSGWQMTAGVHSGVCGGGGGGPPAPGEAPFAAPPRLPLHHQLYFTKPLHGCQEERLWQTRRGLPHKTSKASAAVRTQAGGRGGWSGGLVNLCGSLFQSGCGPAAAAAATANTQLLRYSFIFHACAVCDLKCAIHSAADASQRLSDRISLHSSQLSSLMVGKQLQKLCDQRTSRHRGRVTNAELEELSVSGQ